MKKIKFIVMALFLSIVTFTSAESFDAYENEAKCLVVPAGAKTTVFEIDTSVVGKEIKFLEFRMPSKLIYEQVVLDITYFKADEDNKTVFKGLDFNIYNQGVTPAIGSGDITVEKKFTFNRRTVKGGIVEITLEIPDVIGPDGDGGGSVYLPESHETYYIKGEFYARTLTDQCYM